MYAGFQRWWVQVQLPQGSTLISDPGPMRDPDEPNGGSYLAELFPDTSGNIDVRFNMPTSESILIRRQPGVTVGSVTITDDGCRETTTSDLDRDREFALNALCAAPAANQ